MATKERASESRGTRKPRARKAAGRDDRITRAYGKLRELIVWGKLAPGTRIVESDIAERLEVSRTPIRSALQRLQQEGFITASEGGKQARLSVAPLTREDAQELFHIVGMVEGLAARRAAQLETAARKQLVRGLEELNEELRQAAGSQRPETTRIFDVDTEFHHRYVEAAAGPRLLALHDSIKPQAERYLRLYVGALVGEIDKSVEEHRETVRAIRAGDGDAAQRAVEENWRNAADRFVKVIDALGERGSW